MEPSAAVMKNETASTANAVDGGGFGQRLGLAGAALAAVIRRCSRRLPGS